MNPYILRIALFLFGSGFCALVYQLAWLRLLRLVFGSSTYSSAAVLAIFMGGLGLGGYLLGRRGDRTANPLNLYANLEIGISLSAAASVLLIAGVRALYIGAGGSAELGIVLGSSVRLVLAALVLALPTFLMGGTLPATVRAATRAADTGRHTVGLLYAVNTLGAVAGAMVTTFFLIEFVGIQQTIWLACLLNLLVAMAARATARRQGMVEPPAQKAPAQVGDGTPRRIFYLVLFAAAAVGFVFFVMELVWYRMMGPILGGSTYTFGIILAVALLGIGVGGLLYGLVSIERRATPVHFAVTCALEALAIALPFAVGDRIAYAALELRGLQGAGFVYLVIAWTLVTCVVVLPAALVAGYQFPLLVALLGSGRERVAREVGLTYAWNTVGAILGSIAGGFVLIPLLSAPTSWRLSVWLLAGLAALFLLAGGGQGGRLRRLAPAAIALAALLFTLADGPTAFWRHGGIGAGRLHASPESPNELRDLVTSRQRTIEWEVDGRESSVALVRRGGYAFLVNGKSDGSARGDAPTQVFSGLIAAALHPAPESGLVIGLGTGSSAGWLAAVEGMERVDVAELEPAIRRVAEDCAPVNRNALELENVNLVIADGRELLLASDKKYDVIFSEPSNPYRAGIASLFTREFYQAAARGLDEEGIFVQWLQAYEVDSQVVRTAFATMASVFPHVETWQVHRSDLLLVASNGPIRHDLDRIRARVEAEPVRTAMQSVWGVSGLEGFYTGYLASPAFAAAVLEQEGEALNTDDHPIIEFGFARHVGRKGLFSLAGVRTLAELRGEGRPQTTAGEIDWQLVEELREARGVLLKEPPRPVPGQEPERRARARARAAYMAGDLRAAYEHWTAQAAEPEARSDLALVAESMAEMGDERTPEVARRLGELQPVEGLAVMARWHLRGDRLPEATATLAAAFEGYRRDPWPWLPLMQRTVELTTEIAERDLEQGRRLYAVLAEPFVLALLEDARLLTLVNLAQQVDFAGLCAAAFTRFEPHVPWTATFLRQRRDCYEASGHPLAATAQRQYGEFNAQGELPMWWGLLPEQSVETAPLELPADEAGSRSR